MKQVTMFMLGHCPHCAKAKEMMEEVFVERPEYRNVPVVFIDEGCEPDYAAKFDYYYVPCFYVEGEKLHEGKPNIDAIRSVFETAYS